MIWLRSALFNLMFLGGTVLTVLFGTLLLAAPAWVMVTYIRGYARLMVGVVRLVCGIRLEVTGLDNIPPGPAIIAAKHQSAFDTFVWLALQPNGRDPVYVLKQELSDLPLWGRLAARCGHIAVDRAAGASALRSMVRAAQGAIAAGRPVVIFPEGTRTAPGESVTYQPGVAALANATGAPVVPAATDSGLYWGRRAFQKRPGTIRIEVLPALPTGLPRAKLMAALEDAIEDATAALTGLPRPGDKSGEGDSVISDSEAKPSPITT
jgi:1-acyl-sn-glycerol-3-phosphate acyltransferase